MKPKRILLLSAYDARSHRYWHQQLQRQFPQHNWQVLSLKDRYFSWRISGNAMSFAATYDSELQQTYDLLLATSMTDLCSLRGMYPHLAHIPNLLYFHENQFAYPSNERQQGLKEIQLSSIYAAMVADHLCFNSQFNRDSFLSGVASFTQQMPDGTSPNLHHQLRAKSNVLAVPIAADCQPNQSKKNTEKNHLHVVWNHRWEHDKGPDTLLALLQLCQSDPTVKQTIKFHILGQQFRTAPAAMQTILQQHSGQCINLGFIESREQYLHILQSADVAISTALHDFQGIALLEAVACGCVPLAPDRLVYPELYPAPNLYPSTPEDPLQEARQILNKLQHLDALPAPDVSCTWAALAADYAHWLDMTT